MAMLLGDQGMDYAARQPEVSATTAKLDDERGAPRFTLLIRAAKLVTAQGEFICVIRDVSSTGLSVRTFHRLPEAEQMELRLQDGSSYDIRRIWTKDGEAGFEFAAEIDVTRLIQEDHNYPKRGLRLDVQFPVTVCSEGKRFKAFVDNVSQQGARIECDGLFAIDQNVRIESTVISERHAKVRWRRDEGIGVVFDDTFSLADFARLAARLQCPSLLRE